MKRTLVLSIMSLLAAGWSHSQAKAQALFDVEARRAALAQPAFAGIRAACLAIARDPSWANLKAVGRIEGSDGAAANGKAGIYAWPVMVLTGRALAGDTVSEASLRDLLSAWAKARAFDQTESGYPAGDELNRVLLPIMAGYSVVQRGWNDGQRQSVLEWIGALVRKAEHVFDTEALRGIHRPLPASILMAWGSLAADEALYGKGQSGYRAILAHARPDGSLPLEAGRGARALWFLRQSIASMTVMAEIAAARGRDLYGVRESGANYDRVLSYLLNGITEPAVVMAYASENRGLGADADFRRQDLGFLARADQGRHLMAWVEPVIARERVGLATRRLKALVTRSLRSERPLIDELVGGNATCLWGR